mmetsp:Transcript_21215/g.34739  ORF Transcript_21215/g.34739 Transcript_21215/m.34739 type:complete len:1607 (+) Transcript_21215:45-4865(+)
MSPPANIITDDEEQGTKSSSSGSSSSSPSLLRICLSAGFVSQSSDGLGADGGNAAHPTTSYSASPHRRKSTDSSNGRSSTPKRRKSVMSSDEGSKTLTLIRTAQGIANSSGAAPVSGRDPQTLAALSALGHWSHSHNGVTVNIIDPTTQSTGGITYNQASPAAVPSTPPHGGVGGSLFKTLRGDDTNNNNSNNSNNPPSSWDTNASQKLNLYSKLTSTFSELYNSTLHSINLNNKSNSKSNIPLLLRTKPTSSLKKLPVKLKLQQQPINTPEQWHDNPYCHIYIACCENVDHYRAKVRPAVKAFVNQIEGSGIMSRDNTAESMATTVSPTSAAATAAAAAGGKEKGKKTANEKALAKLGHVASKSSEAGNFGSRYIIVFVPIGSGATSTSGANSTGAASGAGGGFGGFRAGKKGGGVIVDNKYNNNVDDNGSVATATTSSSTDGASNSNNSQQYNTAAAAYPPGPIAHSSKEVKELYHKFLKDFPNGRTVILGTLLDADVSTISPLKNQEWKAFLHNLGGAIVDGFGDRVRRYDEELRRLDSKRAAFVRKISGEHSEIVVGGGADKKNGLVEDGSGFDLSHFFLVKESLAFTYEQMQLPGEAKLQYEELNAFLPEEAWRQLAQQQELAMGGKGENNNGVANNDTTTAMISPSDLAMAGDSERFRKLIKSSGRDLRGVSKFVPQYMYSREVRLLFQMGSPVDVLSRSKEFLVKEYRSKLLDVGADFGQRWKKEIERIGISMNSSSEKLLEAQSAMKQDRLKKEAEIEAWALSSCWDVKCAAEHYFTLSPPEVISEDGKKDEDTAISVAAPTVEGQDAARCIAELLEFAILRLIRLGELALGEEKVNPIRRATSERPADTLKPWVPWKELRKQSRSKSPERKTSSSEAWTIHLSPHVSSWVRNAFSSSSTYEDTYLELAKAAVYINRRAGRFRFASRLEDHRAEVLISRGEYNLAADVLSNNVGACARDQWNRAHYWRIFRLACCQRVSGDVLAYLETLTQSFNPRLSSVAPKKTASLFQNDLEALITDAAVAEPRWGAFPFLETELSIESETAGKSSQPLPFLRRKLSKYLTYVGDELRFNLNINSHLPRAISVNGIRLYLVTLASYEQVYRRNGTVSEEDAFRILSIDAPITIEPGKNQFSFSWQPMSYNVYVLATVEIQWKEASFFYDSALLRKPLVGLDIQPSEPTQTIELNPLFLIPGHVQNVRLVFHSGSDIITGGAVTLICSEGLQVVPPNTDQSKLEEAWSDECVIPLGACKPGKKIVITTLVKSTSSRSGNDADDIQEMMAKVETSYRHLSYNSVMEKGEEPDSNPMTTLLEAMVTTLDRPALAVDGSEAFVFDEDRVMVNVSLQCNTPVPFYVKEWNLDLPSPLVVEEDGDLNKGMFQHAIPEGEMLLFGFKCLRADDSDEPSNERPILRVVLQDDFGKTFLQVLPLNLDDIYKQLRKEDEYAELHNATAELVCSVKEGSVGHPVPFVYNLNLQSLISPKARRSNMSVSVASEGPRPTILYTIISEGSDWIVSGKVQGLIDSKQSDIVSIPFRGIPTRSGLLRHFPEIIIEYLPITTLSGSLSQTPPITVLTKTPERFKSLAFTNSLSLAVPQDLEEF